MKPFQGGLRIAFLCFFVSHIPITICIDGQAALSPYYPQILRDLVAWYCSIFGDVLMKGEPKYESWFSSIVASEVLFQLPFFFVATEMIRREYKDGERYPEWFRRALLVYGSHVSTTLIPILGTFAFSEEMTPSQKCMTIAIYSPYLIFPFLCVCYAFQNDNNNDGGESLSKKKST